MDRLTSLAPWHEAGASQRPVSPLELLIRVQALDSTGQLLVLTGQGQQIQIGLDVGRIVQIGYGPRRGRAALELASTELARSATFLPGPATSWDGDLPSERALLGQLSRMLAGVNGEPSAAPAGRTNGVDRDGLEGVSTGPPPSARTADTTPAGDHRDLSSPLADSSGPARLDSALTAIEIACVKEVLLEFVGPMAAYLVDECVLAGSPDVAALVDAVAGHIDSERDAQAFRAAAGRIDDRSP